MGAQTRSKTSGKERVKYKPEPPCRSSKTNAPPPPPPTSSHEEEENEFLEHLGIYQILLDSNVFNICFLINIFTDNEEDYYGPRNSSPTSPQNPPPPIPGAD